MYEEENQVELTIPLIQSLKMAKIFKDMHKEVNAIDFSTDGTLLAACDDTSLHIYDVVYGKKTRTLLNKIREIDLVRFTHNKSGILCVTKKEPFEIYYWSLHDNEIIKKFTGHTDAILTLDICPTSDYFLTCSQDMTLRLWDLSSDHQECEAKLDLTNNKTHCVGAFDPSGVAFAVSYSEIFSSNTGVCRVFLYDLKKIQQGCFESWKYEFPQIKILKFSPNGKEILGAAKENNIIIIDAYKGEKKCEIIDYQNDNSIIEASFTPDSQYVISGSESGHIYFWTCEKGELIVKLEGHQSMCRVVKFCPTMAILASGGKNIVLWAPSLIDQEKDEKQQILD